MLSKREGRIGANIVLLAIWVGYLIGAANQGPVRLGSGIAHLLFFTLAYMAAGYVGAALLKSDPIARQAPPHGVGIAFRLGIVLWVGAVVSILVGIAISAGLASYADVGVDAVAAVLGLFALLSIGLLTGCFLCTGSFWRLPRLSR